jgi:hypothetical protein
MLPHQLPSSVCRQAQLTLTARRLYAFLSSSAVAVLDTPWQHQEVFCGEAAATM